MTRLSTNVCRTLGEDLVDVELRALPDGRELLVLAGDQLADQPEREELEADDHEQDAEDQQRPLPDRVPVELERGQVGEDDEAEEARA